MNTAQMKEHVISKLKVYLPIQYAELTIQRMRMVESAGATLLDAFTLIAWELYATSEESYGRGYDDGMLKGSEVGDATASRCKAELDADMADLQTKRLQFVKERAELRDQLETAVRYLEQGKAMFKPKTTNSHVDKFIADYREKCPK